MRAKIKFIIIINTHHQYLQMILMKILMMNFNDNNGSCNNNVCGNDNVDHDEMMGMQYKRYNIVQKR